MQDNTTENMARGVRIWLGGVRINRNNGSGSLLRTVLWMHRICLKYPIGLQKIYQYKIIET